MNHGAVFEWFLSFWVFCTTWMKSYILP